MIVSSLLCFLSSARSDYSYQVLSDIISSFYSYEEIKKGKETLCNILKEDIVTRRDPDKKKKELNDLLDFHEKLVKSKRKMRFVTDSYRRMPPIGLQMFAPILSNLAEEIVKINDFLPKILDMKSEVLNTADTVRNMKIDINDIKDKFRSAISGMEEAAKDITSADINALEELHSFRQSSELIEIVPDCSNIQEEPTTQSYAKIAAEFTDGGRRRSNSQNKVKDRNTGAITKVLHRRTEAEPATILHNPQHFPQLTDQHTPQHIAQSTPQHIAQHAAPTKMLSTPRPAIDKQPLPHGGWTVVQSNKRNKGENEKRKPKFTGVTGSRKNDGMKLKAVTRSVDVFLGRVDKDETCESIKEYILENFEVYIVDIAQHHIRSDIFNAFKITVRLVDREKLFNAELWPEDILIDKFYNRSKRTNDREPSP